MSAQQKTVLVVDDEPPVLRCLRREFVRAGHHVLTATSGEEAMALLASTRVDALITDHRMPGMLGSELVTRAAALQPWLRRIIVTGSPEDVRLFADDDVALVTKPWPPGALLALAVGEAAPSQPSDGSFGAVRLASLFAAHAA